jgi:hypothetical protein
MHIAAAAYQQYELGINMPRGAVLVVMTAFVI